jgi:sporulation related protein
VLAAACTAAPGPKVPSDVEDAHDLATQAGELLVRMSAYDYALAGTLGGRRTYVVDQDRYAQVVQTTSASIQRFSAAALSATIDRAGPLRDRLVALADGLVDLSRDATAYADGSDPEVFARVTADVARSWDDLRALQRTGRPVDDELAKTIGRGSSFVVESTSKKVFAITVGPYANAAEADAAVKKIGTVELVSRVSPFVVRVGTYADQKTADTAMASLSGKGFTGLRTEETKVTFTRTGPSPDVELWREPERVFDTWGNARRVAISPNALWVATGSDDGTVAIFTGDGVLRSLPKFNAGVSQLVFSEDARWLMGGGQTLASFILPQGTAVGSMVRLASPAQQVVYVPTAYYFAAIAKGPTGEPSGGSGVLTGRAPDGQPLSVFPIEAPAAGGALAATASGELYIATTSRGTNVTDIEVLNLAKDKQMRGVLTVPGQVQELAVDRSGILGAVQTDQGLYRFGPHDADPKKTLFRMSEGVKDFAFGPGGRLYTLEKGRITARDLRGEAVWSAPLVDGRRLVIASRPVVLDAAGRLLVFDDKGQSDDLGVSGNVQDVSASADGQRVAVLTEGRRALIFKLP